MGESNSAAAAIRRRPLRRAIALTLAAVQVVYPAIVSAQAIVTDGRTQTTVGTAGNVVNITTGTVTGANAFNSFSKFGVPQGVTANLYVPGGAANLINIVRDQRTDIYGILNSIKDGKIGGNVWFANPYGFLVGASGVVNVGSLTLSTPTQQFVDGFFLSPGSPDQGAVAQLLAGTAPRSGTGMISIQGKVNAIDGVTLSSGAINVAGSVFSGARFVGSAPDFSDVVNANGLASAGNVVVREGRITIVADNDVTLSGTLAAPGGPGVRGGDIAVTAGGSVDLQPGALVSARGNGANSAGGSILVLGGDNATFQAGAKLDASAGASGDGGAIELSAKNTVTLAGGEFAAGAANGRLGSVLVDPNNIEVVASNQIVSGANYSLVANNSITVNSGVVVSTRNIGGSIDYDNAVSAGNSGDISLSAPSITLNSGSKLLAHVDNGSAFQGGAVTLSATQAGGGTSQINLSQATVKGKSVSLQASSTLTDASPGLLVLSGINSSDATASVVVDSSQIAASGGALNIGATTSVNVSATGPIPLAVLRSTSSASVDVKGGSSLMTTAGDATLSAASTVTTNATPTSPLASLAADAMVATSDVTSNANVHVGGTTTLNVAGTLGLAATNTVTTTQIANASAAGGSAAGAVVALSLVSSTTSATVDGQANIASANALDLSALSKNTATVTAKSAAQGAQEDTGGGSKSSQALAKYKDSTNTADSGSSGGGVKVAGAVAVSDVQASTQASLGSTQLATVHGAATLTSRATNSAAVSADGSATSGSIGVGVAVAVNIAKSTNQAYVGQNLNAQSLAITAGMNAAGATNQFATSAVSGAGASSVGVAGSIAVNALGLASAASVNSGFTVGIAPGGTGDVSLSAENLSASSAASTPAAGGATGSKVGIGAAVAVNVVSNRATAEIQDTAQLTGARDLTLQAAGADAVSTQAEAGAAGGVAITPVAAINVVNNTTRARIGSSATPLTLTGDLLVQADQIASATASAKGSTQGAKAAVGAAVAVALVDDEVTATTARSIVADGSAGAGKGAVSFLAHGASASSASAIASAVGGKSDDEKSSDDGDVDTKVGKQMSAGTNVQKKNNVGDSAEQSKTSGAAGGKPSASSSEGKISVAAAVSVNLQNSTARAQIPDNGTVTAAGAVTLSSSNNTDGAALTDGSAVGSTTTVGIGAGISVNLVKSVNEASIGQGAQVSGKGLTLEAGMTDVKGDGSDLTNTLYAEAKSGAGGSKVGLAGSLALNIADTSSQALVKSGAQVNAGGGDVVLAADDRTSTTGKALPADGGGASGGKLGIGASVAVNVVANRSTAEIQDGAQLTGARDLTLQANGAFDMLTETEAGSQGGISITPSVAVSLASNSTTARVGSSATPLTLTGDLLVQGDQVSSTTTTAKGSSQGEKAAIGAAVAVALVDDEVLATTAREINATGAAGAGKGAVSFLAYGASASSASATASAVGGKTDDEAGQTDPATGTKKEDASVDDKVGNQTSFGKKQQTDNNVGNAKQKGSTASADADKPSASSSEGKISVAAAVSVNLQNSSARAVVPDAGKVTAAGAIKLASSNNTDGTALTDGSAVGSTTTLGIGAGVSVNLVKSVNEASIGTNAQVTASGVTLEAKMTDVKGDGSDLTHTLDAEAKSGAGGTKVGLAGSLALNIVDTSSQALIKGGATVNALGGDVSLAADDRSSVIAKALPADGGGASGGSVGIGASVAVNIVANRSTAEIRDTATLNGPGNVSLAASGVYAVETEAEAGATGGVAITPVLSLALVNNTTSARLGSGNALINPGSVSVTADHDSTTTTSAKGSTQGEKAAIGAAVGVVLLNDVAIATTDRNIQNATGDVTLAAHASSASTNSATASATGGKSDDEAGQTDAATGKKKEDASVDDKVGGQLTYGKDTQTKNKVGDTSQQSSTSSAASGKPSAQSDEGTISVAAAVAVNIVAASATASVADGRSVSTSGAFKLSATGNTDGIAKSDGTVVGKTQKVGIGAAVSVNKVDSHTEASIGSNASVTAQGVTLEAKMTDVAADKTNTIDAQAQSGAGGSKVGIAASLALNIADTSSKALVKSGASVDAGGGAVDLSAEDRSTYIAKAEPTTTGGATGGKVGVGVSVALNLLTSASQAQIGSGAGVSNSGSLSLSAVTEGDSTAVATAGSTGGKVAFDAAVAVTTLNQTTDASIASGSDIGATGNVGLSATSSGEHVATTKGVAKSGSVAIGASVGVITSTSSTTASIDRNVSAGGTFGLAASSTRSYDAGATASAGGSQGEQTYTDNKTQADNASSTKSLNNNQNSSTNQGTQGGGKVAVAAAVSVVVIDDDVKAQVTGGRTIQAGAASDVQVTASNLSNFSARGAGDAVDPNTKVGVGVGVGIVIANNDTTASLADNTHLVQAGNVTVKAESKQNTDPSFSHKLSAEGIAGAGGNKVGIAGAFAVVDSNTRTSATIGANTHIDQAGSVVIDAENTSMLAAKAWAGAVGGNAGIGASVATVISDNEYTALLGGGSNVTASSLAITARNNKIVPGTFTLSVSSIDDVKTLPDQFLNGSLLGGGNYYTEAVAGAGSGQVAVVGSFAVSVFKDKTDASIGAGATVDTGSGTVALTASNDTVVRSLAGGAAVGGSVGVGVSSAAVGSTNVTSSHIDAGAQITHSGGIALAATNKQDIELISFAASGGGSVGVGGVANVITLQNTVEAYVANSATTVLNSSGGLALGATNTVTGLNIASGIAVGGSAGVGVAGAVNTLGTDASHQFATHAYIGDGVTANAATATTLTASASENLTTFAIGGAAGGTAGVGGAAVVNVINTDTRAYVGANAKVNKAQSLVNQSVGVNATDATTLFSVVGAVGVGGTAGVGASGDVAVITKSTQAYVGNGAWVETAGNLAVQAASSEDFRSIALGFGAGGTAGVAGSVSVYALTTTTKGYLDDNTTLRSKGSALISADDATVMDIIAGSASGGGVAAVGAGVGVSVFSKTTQASIGSNADVEALGNGASGISAATGDYNVSFGAAISGDGKVTDSGVSAKDAQGGSVGNRDAFQALTKQRNATQVTSSMRGLAVTATNKDKLESFAVTGAAAGAAAITVGGSVAVTTTTTEASIGSGTKVNQTGTAGNAAQSVRVAAGNDQFHLGLAGAASGAGGAAIGAGADVLVASNTTKATIGADAKVKAARDVEVLARSQEQYLEMGMGLAAAGSVAIAGSVGVISLNDTTYATIVGGSASRVDAGGNVRVSARDDTETNMVAGAAAAGFGTAGFGAAVGVNSITKDTRARVGSDATINALGGSGAAGLTAYLGNDVDGTTSTMHGLLVQATSKEDLFMVSASGAGGLFAAVSGAVTVSVVNSNTSASIGDNAKINLTNAGAAADQGVNVSARNQLDSLAFTGSVAIAGGGALSGGVDVLTAKNNTSASIGNGAEVHAAGNVAVNALSKNKLSTVVVSAAGGLAAGIAGGIAVYSVGDKLSSDAQGQMNASGDVNAQADNEAKDGTLGSLFDTSTDSRAKSISSDAQAKRAAISTSGAVSSGPPAAGNSASIGSGAQVFAGGDVAVNARGSMDFGMTAGAAAVGFVGLGAGVGVANFTLNNQAWLGANAEITAGGDVKVRASLDENASGLGFAGSGGIVAVNAALAMFSDDSTTRAWIGSGAKVHQADEVIVEAKDVRRLDAQALGASIGAVAGGASVATTSVGGTTSAFVDGGAQIGAGADVAGSLSVTADSTVKATSSTMAAAGGLGLAASGSVATATAAPVVSAYVNAGTAELSGSATVQATGRAGASADAEGFNVSIVASVGASVASATSTPQISAYLAPNTSLTANSLTVSATQALPDYLFAFDNTLNRTQVFGVSTLANASGASGALFAGINATSSEAAEGSQVLAYVGNNSTLDIAGSATVSASNTSDQRANASGLAFGIVAVGANLASAHSNSLTNAYIGDGTKLGHGAGMAGALHVTATGHDSNLATSTSGSGGLVSGAAATASTFSASQTLASTGSGDLAHQLAAKALEVRATHTTRFNGSVDSVNASLVGASGATIEHAVFSTVAATIGNGAQVAANSVVLKAENLSYKFWLGAGTVAQDNAVKGDDAPWNINSGSGGLIDLPAGSSTSLLHHVTTASVGDNANVHVFTPAIGVGSFNMDAYNAFVLHDKAKLDSGGAIAIASAVSKVIIAQSDASAVFGTNSQVIMDSGDLNAGARSNVNMDVRASANAYGLAGAPSGTAHAVYQGNNQAVVNSGALLQADDGGINLSGGEDSAGTPTSIFANASVNLWNKTAIPMSTDPDAQANISNNANVAILGTSQVLAAGDIGLYADKGSVNAKAKGIGKDLYREAAAAVASGVSNLFGGGDVSFDITGGSTSVGGLAKVLVDGNVLTGTHRTESLTLGIQLVDALGNPVSSPVNAPVYETDAEGKFVLDGSGNKKVVGSQVLWLMKPTATSGITYSIRTGVSLAADIQARIEKLRSLMSQYAGDSVAVGAYQSEINFLQIKLVELGLASQSGTDAATGQPIVNPGQWNNPSPRAIAQAQIKQYQGQYSSAVSTVNAAGTLVNTKTGSAAAAVGTIAGNVGSIDSNYATVAANNGSVQTQLLTLANKDANNATYKATYTNANSLVATNATLVSEIDARKALNATDLITVNSKNGDIGTALSEIATRKSQIDTLAQSTSPTAAAQIATLQTEIDTRQASIGTRTGEINTLLGGISTRNGEISTRASQVVTNNTQIAANEAALVTAFRGGAGDDGIVASINTVIGNNVAPRSSINTAAGSISTQQGLFTGAGGFVLTVAGQDTTIQTALVDKSSAQTQIATLSSDLPNKSTVAANGPIADFVDVNDVTVRLGNIRTKGDLLTGSGKLSAPGDAQITITNNTPDFLTVKNLTVLSDEGGTIRHNGVLVNSNSDINAVNVAVPGQAANFSTVLTRDTQGAGVPKPAITINSNYNPLGGGAAVLAPAPNIELKGDITNLRGSVTVHSAAGSILSNGSIHAGTVDVKASNGDFVQSFVDNFFHVGGDPASIHDNGTALGPGIIANGSVFISARYLNINSLVQSGIEQWTLNLPKTSDMLLTGPADFFGLSKATLDADKATYLNLLALNGVANPFFNHTRADGLTVTYDAQQDRIEVTKTFADADRNTANWATRTAANNGLYQLVSDYGNIGASYDPVNTRFVLDGTQVRGGLIQLYGQVINTSTNGAGKLRVLDGFGQIKVNNPTELPVVLNVLDTGSDPTGTGRGVAGVIDITDVQGIGSNGTNQTTTHTIYTRTGGPSGVVLRNGVADGNASDGRHTSYGPQSDLRYVWTTGTDNSSVTYWEYKGAQFFGSSDLRTSPSGTVVSQSGPFVLNSYRLDSGTYLSKGSTLGGTHAANNTAGNNFASTSGTTVSKDGNGNDIHYWVKTDEWSNCNWWTLCIAQDYHMTFTETTPSKTITTKSLKADNPIAIEFSGYDSGLVQVNSASSVLLKGSIRNRTGDTTINAGSGVVPHAGVSTAGSGIVQVNDSALISTKNLTLNATGSIGAPLGGDPAKAIAVDVAGGVLNASAGNGNVLIRQTLGALNVGTVTAAGNALSALGRVNLQSDGSILAAGPGSLIQGQQVELTSENGGIGSIGTPLNVNVGYTDSIAQRGFYGLKASARGDIGIATGTWSGNTAGNLLVNTVVSSGGDVLLAAPGRIIDNNPTEQIDTRTWNELVNFWDSIGLRAGSAENLANQQMAVKSFEQGRTQDYRLYWQIRNRQANPAAFDPSFQYHATAGEKAALTAQGMSAGDIAVFEANRTAQYQLLNTEVGGLNGGVYSTGFQYAATPTETAAILNKSSWTDRELGISITPGLLKDITNTNPVVKSANAQGRKVTLNAGIAIGETQASVTVPVTVDPSCSAGPNCLTDDMKVALAAAERSDLDLSNPNQITVLRRKPFNFDASTSLNATVANTASAEPDNGKAFLASLGDGRLGSIQVPGETRIKVRGSIVNESGASPAVQTGNLVLEAASGGIGYLPDTGLGATVAPLRVELNPGATLTARAAENVDITGAGDLNVDTVFSRKDAKLTAAGSISDGFGNSELKVLGATIHLTALTGSIGTLSDLLDVGVNLTGSITASAGQGVYLNGPLGRSFNIASVNAGDAVKLAADIDMKIDGPVNAPGPIGLVAGGTMTLTPNAAVHATVLDLSLDAGALLMQDNGVNAASIKVDAGTINIQTVGDAVITGVSTGNGTVSAISVVSTAGRILDGGDVRIDITADTPPAALLTISGALGVGANPLEVQLLNLKATSGGVVDLAVQNSVNIVALQAADSVLLTAGGSITGNSVISSGTGAGPDKSISVTSATGSVDLVKVAGSSDVAITGQTGVKVGTGSASGEFSLAAVTGNVDAGSITANSIDLSAPGSVTAGALNAGSTVKLAGDVVTASVFGGATVIGGSVTGFNGGIASNVNLTLSGPAGFGLTSFSTATGSVSVPIGSLVIDSVLVVDRATFTNPSTKLLVDQHDRSIQPFDVQLYSGGAPLFLELNQNHVFTDSFVIFRGPLFEVITRIASRSVVEQSEDTLSTLNATRAARERRAAGEDDGALVTYTGFPVSLEGDCRQDTARDCPK